MSEVQHYRPAINVLVSPDKIAIHWHRHGSDFYQCGECGPDIVYTYNMDHVTCLKCRRSMYRTKEWRKRNAR